MHSDKSAAYKANAPDTRSSIFGKKLVHVDLYNFCFLASFCVKIWHKKLGHVSLVSCSEFLYRFL